ncbi:MAG: TetR/AcrR family transcriptional regulator C-terminal domain-containing protein [Bifidobacteriaceae bacterium]|jgi:probable dihydroxyacetone kinase regulator|nr:TetR/AcrR family transcriptional regulator C-terminal domain-containing protein [Bifidobacteriaceae bacterium]
MCQAKLKIATATKDLVVTHDFGSITVADIVTTAGLRRRQTFYDYFRDKYDVLEWIYRTEITEVAPNCTTYRNWPSTLRRMLHYFDENQPFYRKVLELDERNAPEEVIARHISEMIGIIFSDLGETEHLLINDSYCTFLQRMLSSALLDELKAHLTSDKHETTDEEIADLRRYIEDGINGLLLRTGRISSYLSSAQ